MVKVNDQGGFEAPQILLRVLLVLAVIESNRGNLVLSELITRLKDIFLILFCLSMAARSRWLVDTDFFARTAYGWFFLLMVLTVPITVYSSATAFGMEVNMGRSFSWAFHLRAIYFGALIYSLRGYFQRYAQDLRPLASFFTIACLAFVVFNTAAYFYHFPFLTKFRPQPGRISNGYPTADAQMLLMAVTAYGYTVWTGIRKDYLITGFLIVGVIANATTSGLAALLLLSLHYAMSGFRQRPGRTVMLVGGAILAVLAAVGAGYLALDYYFHDELEKIQALYKFKSSELLALMNGDTGSRNSGTIRIDEFNNVYKFNESLLDRIFGLGSFYGYVENQFLHVLVTWGAAGLFVFLATILETYTATARSLRGIATCFLIIWIMAGTVLITTYLFPVFVPFCIFAAALMTRETAPYWKPQTQIEPSPDGVGHQGVATSGWA